MSDWIRNNPSKYFAVPFLAMMLVAVFDCRSLLLPAILLFCAFQIAWGMLHRNRPK